MLLHKYYKNQLLHELPIKGDFSIHPQCAHKDSCAKGVKNQEATPEAGVSSLFNQQLFCLEVS